MLPHICHCKAVMEEADIRSAEVKKASYEFERDIVKGAVNQVLQYIINSISHSRNITVEFVSKVNYMQFTINYVFADFAENQ